MEISYVIRRMINQTVEVRHAGIRSAPISSRQLATQQPPRNAAADVIRGQLDALFIPEQKSKFCVRKNSARNHFPLSAIKTRSR